MKSSPTYVDYIDSPIGELQLGFNSAKKLMYATFNESEKYTEISNSAGISEIEKVSQQFLDYFNGNRKAFDISFELQGTDFQKKVWHQLLKVPFGTTVSYQEIAHRLGNPKAIRAAAAANGKNPIAIVVPCHRIIGSDGSLTGYAGGLHRKKWLLNHEKPDFQYALF